MAARRSQRLGAGETEDGGGEAQVRGDLETGLFRGQAYERRVLAEALGGVALCGLTTGAWYSPASESELRRVADATAAAAAARAAGEAAASAAAASTCGGVSCRWRCWVRCCSQWRRLSAWLFWCDSRVCHALRDTFPCCSASTCRVRMAWRRRAIACSVRAEASWARISAAACSATRSAAASAARAVSHESIACTSASTFRWSRALRHARATVVAASTLARSCARATLARAADCSRCAALRREAAASCSRALVSLSGVALEASQRAESSCGRTGARPVTGDQGGSSGVGGEEAARSTT